MLDGERLFLCFAVRAHRKLVTVGGVEQLAAFLDFELLSGHVCRHRCEVGVDQRIRVSLTTLASEATVIEACSHEHLPDCGVTPIVGCRLRPNADVEVVMTALQVSWRSVVLVPVEADHVLLQLLECLIESLLVVLALAFTVGDETTSISDEKENTTMVNTVQTRHVSHTVRVHENHSELTSIKALLTLVLEVALGASSLIELLLIGIDFTLFRLGLRLRLNIMMVLLASIVVELHVLSSSELLEHNHLIAAVLR